jgi:hypothetical protein
MNALKIEFPADGEVVSRHDGRETAKGLTLRVRGTCPKGARVKVNGKAAKAAAGRFEAEVTLTQPRETIEVATGAATARARVLYDRHSFPRWRFSVDDVIWCFTEVARHPRRYRSIFDHWFFAFFRKLHRDFGAQVQMNIYYEDPEAEFDLTEFPSRFKGEWRDNAGWLRLSFHARSDRCYNNRIYRDATRETLLGDWRKVVEQIVRFAGEETLCREYTTIHWAEFNREVASAVRDAGARGVTGRFGMSAKGEPYSTRLHFDEAANARLHSRCMAYDPERDLYAVNCPQFLNNVPVGLVAWHYDRLVDGTGGRAPFDVIDFLVHEEHFWKGFMGGKGYHANNQERCLTAGLWAVERGLKPVCFEKGLAGNVS